MDNKQKEQIFNELIREKTLIRMELLDTSFETLTMAIGVVRERGAPRLLLDCPRGFKAAVNGNTQLKLRFEYTDKDKIKYSFNTIGGHIISDEIVLSFPDTIKRHQRRQHFRVEVPSGTLLNARDKGKLKLNVINISMGGALITLSTKGETGKSGPKLKVGGRLHEIDLVLPFRDEKQIVDIRKLLIVRMEAPEDNNQCYGGLQITHISPNEKKRLNELIYEVQREMLRKRHLFS